MPSPVVVAQTAGGLRFLAQQAVHQGGFSHAGGADKRHGSARGQVRQKGLYPVRPRRAGKQHIRTRRRLLHGGDLFRRVGAQIGFRQNDHRRGPAVPRGGQIPFQPPEVEIMVECHAQEQNIHIGCHRLLLPARSRRPCSSSRLFRGKYLMDHGLVPPSFQFRQHIIAHNGIIGRADGLVLHFPRYPGGLLPAVAHQPIQTLFLRRHSAAAKFFCLHSSAYPSF